MESLAAELSADLDALGRIGTEIQEATIASRREPADPFAVDALAVRLQRLYGCAEDVAYRVSVHINGEVPGGPQSHKELLDRTGMEVPGKRRALWSETSLQNLHELRKFRHFFRTRYALQMDRDKVLEVADRALAALPGIERDVQEFIGALPSS